MHHAAKVNVVPRLFSISYEDGVSDLKFKLLSGTNIYKKISPVLGCLRVSDSKGRYINSDISEQSFAIEGSLTKSNLVSLSKATRRVLSGFVLRKTVLHQISFKKNWLTWIIYNWAMRYSSTLIGRGILYSLINIFVHDRQELLIESWNNCKTCIKHRPSFWSHMKAKS